MVKIFLNKGGKFDDKPDHELGLPQLAQPSKIRVLPAAKGGIADLFVGGQSAALLVADGKLPKYKVIPLDVADGHQVRVLDDGTHKQTVIAGRFSGLRALDTSGTRPQVSRFKPEVTGPYVDKDDKEMLKGGGTQITYPSSRYRGPGHNSILEEDGKYWIVYHAYDALNGGTPTLRIVPLQWDAAGWPFTTDT